MELDQIKELISYVEKSKIAKLTLKKGDFEVQIEKESAHLPPPPISRPVVHEEMSHSSEPIGTKAEKSSLKHHEPQGGGVFVSSPMVGTFYASPAPDQPPFVKIGDKIQENTVVCIVEAMKVMNEVKAGVSGKVVEVIAEHGHPVEFGSRLFRIQPL